MTAPDRQETSLGSNSIGFADALRFWLKLGFISFGGPAGQIAIMHEELVERRRWISEKRFLHALNYCMMLPGPEAQQLATYIGWLMHRTSGALAAGILFVAPSLLILIALSWIYAAYGQQPLIAGIFYGIKPAVTAIVLQAAIRIGSRTLRNALLWSIAVAAFVAIFLFKTPFPLIVTGAALIGILCNRIAPDYFRQRNSHGKNAKNYGPALIDDDTPPPPHARFSYRGLAKIIVAGVLLWTLPMAAFVLRNGWHSLAAQLGWFFTKAAWLTFGGAYAVLPYVYQGAVSNHGWLSATQMIDGLALGETTPGPLIMVVSFVGFIAGYARPLIESTRNDMKFTAPLTAITAAVVGVIVNLAVFFAYHIFWPNGFEAKFDTAACAIASAASIALIKFKRGVIGTLGASAAAGLAVTFMR